MQESRELNAKAAEADYGAAVAAKTEAIAAIPVKSLEERLEMAKAELALTEIRAPCGRHGAEDLRAAPASRSARSPILRDGQPGADGGPRRGVRGGCQAGARWARRPPSAARRFHAPYDKEGLQGKVVAVGRMVNTPELKSLDPFARVDRHVIPVRIELDRRGSVEAGRFVNLQVDIEIHTAEK